MLALFRDIHRVPDANQFSTLTFQGTVWISCGTVAESSPRGWLEKDLMWYSSWEQSSGHYNSRWEQGKSTDTSMDTGIITPTDPSTKAIVVWTIAHDHYSGYVRGYSSRKAPGCKFRINPSSIVCSISRMDQRGGGFSVEVKNSERISLELSWRLHLRNSEVANHP